MDQALHVTHWFIAGLLVVALIWLGWALIAGRRRSSSGFFRGDSRRAALLPLAIAAFVFLVVDGHLLVSSTVDTLGTLHDFDGALARPDVLRLQLNARQWAWDARYAGVDGRFGTDDDVYVTTDIRVPTGRPVVVQIAAVDVVHALDIPNLRVQVDAIPGRITWAWFEVTRAGELDVVCAQHCGVNHYKMGAKLHVLEADEFADWLATESHYATKMVKARAELLGEESLALFPRFGREPDIAPRAWGWPWQEGMD